jgi:hypothetical protein
MQLYHYTIALLLLTSFTIKADENLLYSNFHFPFSIYFRFN